MNPLLLRRDHSERPSRSRAWLKRAAAFVGPLAFALSALTRHAPAAEARDIQPAGNLYAPPGEPSTGAADQGRTLFSRNCAHCHGEDARGGEGPSLHRLRQTDVRIRQIIQQGIKGEMPKFNLKFNNAEIQALVDYLRSLKD